MTGASAEEISWIRVLFASATVAALMAALAFALKWFAKAKISVWNGPASRRLKIVETLPLDLRRRVVILRCDGTEHLLLLGHTTECVIAALPPSTTPPQEEPS